MMQAISNCPTTCLVKISNVLAGAALILMICTHQVLAQSEPRHLAPYLQEIDRIQSEEGVYSGQLSQILTQLGNEYQKQDKHAKALDVFVRALHITRINKGLYHPSQLSIMDQMLSSLIKERRWKDLDNKHYNMYWISLRNFSDDRNQLVPQLLKYANWLLYSHRANYKEGAYVRLQKAEKLFVQAHNLIKSEFGDFDLRLIPTLKGVILTNFFKSRIRQSTPKSELNFSENASSALLSHLVQNSLLNMEGYKEGKLALQKMAEIYDHHPESDSSKRVFVRVSLADWYLLFDKRKSALSTYQEALALAKDLNIDPPSDLFEEPIVLPDSSLFDEDNDKKVSNESRFVLATFDVSQYGRASNIELIEFQPQDAMMMRSRALKFLRSARFRPRFDGDEPVSTQGVRLRLKNP